MHPPHATLLDPDRCIARDLPCLQCGQNLRGVPAASRCPECGEPIVLTLRGGPLAAGDPRWLATVRDGVTALLLVQFWLWLPPAWLAWSAAVWGVTTPSRAPTAAGPWRMLVRWVAQLMGFAGLALSLVEVAVTGRLPSASIGLFALTSPLVTLAAVAPLTTLTDTRALPRLARFAELCALVGLLLSPGFLLRNTPAFAGAGFALGVVGILLVVLAVPLMLVTLTWLWRRIEAAELLSANYRADLTAWGHTRIVERAPTPAAIAPD